MKAMERQNPHREERYPTRASLTPVSLDLKENIKKTFVVDSCLRSFLTYLSDGLMFPASPLDWDTFTDPEYLFTAAPPEPQPGQCRAFIHGLLNGRAVSWEVSLDLGHLWSPESQETLVVEKCSARAGEEEKPWGEMIHQLTARSVIRDFEKMAERESDTGRGEDEWIPIDPH